MTDTKRRPRRAPRASTPKPSPLRTELVYSDIPLSSIGMRRLIALVLPTDGCRSRAHVRIQAFRDGSIAGTHFIDDPTALLRALSFGRDPSFIDGTRDAGAMKGRNDISLHFAAIRRDGLPAGVKITTYHHDRSVGSPLVIFGDELAALERAATELAAKRAR